LIKFLASIFRGIHFIFGISAPPPDHDERRFVFTWLLVILFFIAFSVGLLYAIPHLYVRAR
jgi:nucleoside permease NupC